LARSPLTRTPNRLDPIDNARPMDEQLLGMVVSLTSEISILRTRLDTCERLLVQSGVMTQGAIDDFEPDAAAAQQRDAQRQAIIRKVFRPLTEAQEQEKAG